MANLKVLLLFIVIFCATYSHAQFHVEVVMPAVDKDYIYAFEAISCQGNNCTAIARVDGRDSNDFGYYTWFYRSKDGGLTWEKQDPNFPKKGLAKYIFISLQQIDSLNAVAVSDSGFMFRTFDAGVTWEEIKPRLTTLNLSAVHFADPLHGIVVTACDDLCGEIFTTKDGGRNWSKVTVSLNYSGRGFNAAQCLGDGKYAVMHKGYDTPIFLTNDNWKTVRTIETHNGGNETDTTKSYLRNFHISSTQDTIYLTGQYWMPHPPLPPLPLDDGGMFRRSIDGGATWQNPFVGWETSIFSRVTGYQTGRLVAMGPTGEDTIYTSSNFGETWRTEIVNGNFIFDLPVTLAGSFGISSSSNGIVAVLGNAFQNFITHHPFSTGDLEEGRGKLLYRHRVYPNPVSGGSLNIASIEESTPYRITDMLGRVVADGMVGNKVDISVDVAYLAPGVYFVYVDDLRNGRPIRVGKVTILSQ